MHRLAAALLLTAAAAVQAQSALPTRPADPARPTVSATGQAQPVPIAAPRGGPGPVTTAFTYQGRLEDNGNPANAQYDLRFTLVDDLGATVAGPICIDNVLVTDGVFSVQLDFGPVMTGDARQLRIAVRPGGPVGNCAAGPAYTTLTPDQPLTATPYALGLRLPLQGVRDLPQQHLFTIQNIGTGPLESGIRGIHVGPAAFPFDDSAGLRGESNAGFGSGVLGISDFTAGVLGYTAGGVGRYGVFGRSDGDGGIGVAGYVTAPSGYAIFGLAPDVQSWAGYFSGRVSVLGNLDASGTISSPNLRIGNNAAPGRVLVSTNASGDAAWTQTNTASVSGSSPGVSSTLGFISPVALITVGAGQKVHVTAHQSLGSVSSGGANNLNIYVGVRAQGSGVITTVGGGIFGLTVGQNQRTTFGISGIISGLTPGVYEVGMAGSSTSANWNNNEWGYVTAFTLN